MTAKNVLLAADDDTRRRWKVWNAVLKTLQVHALLDYRGGKMNSSHILVLLKWDDDVISKKSQIRRFGFSKSLLQSRSSKWRRWGYKGTMKKLPDEAKVFLTRAEILSFFFFLRVVVEESALERDYERIHCTTLVNF